MSGALMTSMCIAWIRRDLPDHGRTQRSGESRHPHHRPAEVRSSRVASRASPAPRLPRSRCRLLHDAPSMSALLRNRVAARVGVRTQASGGRLPFGLECGDGQVAVDPLRDEARLSPTSSRRNHAGSLTRDTIVIGGMSRFASGPWRSVSLPAAVSTLRTSPSLMAQVSTVREAAQPATTDRAPWAVTASGTAKTVHSTPSVNICFTFDCPLKPEARTMEFTMTWRARHQADADVTSR